jgi:hypothetical protein
MRSARSCRRFRVRSLDLDFSGARVDSSRLRLIQEFGGCVPFLPLPEIAVDPNSGPTYGLLSVWLRTNANHDITQIIAPDLIYNDYFGYRAHARRYVYRSLDEQWSVSAGFMERVERSFFGQFQRGRLRDTRWSTWINVVYDRDGTARFYAASVVQIAADVTTEFRV